MGKKLFIGSLSFHTTQESLESVFRQSGTIESAKIITDRYTGKSRGFAFVEMSHDEEASKCIRDFDGYELDGRQISVAAAKPPSEQSSYRSNN